MLKRGLILIALLAVPALALGADAPDGPEYHKWIQEQAAKGNPPGAHSGGAGGAVPHNAAEGQFFSPSGGDLQLDYRLQVDYTGLLARLKYLLTSPDWFGGMPEAQQAVAFMEGHGCLNATQYRESLTVDKDLLRYSIAADYAGLSPDSYLGQIFALPNQPFASANYTSSDALLYFGAHNVPQTALKAFKQLASNPQALEQGPLADMLDELTGGDVAPADLAQMAQLIDAMGIEATVSNLLTGEVALAFYGVSDLAKAVEGDIQPADIDACAFLGVRDSAAVGGMLGAYGADMGLVSKGESAGWKLFGFDGEDAVTLALGPDVLLATTNWEATSARLLNRMARLNAPAGQYYVHLDLDRLCRIVEPLAGMAEQELVDMDELRSGFDANGWPAVDKFDAGLRYLLDLEHLGGCGALDISGYYNDGYRSELTMKPSVFIYGMYALGRWGGLAAAQAALEEMDTTSTPGAGLDEPSGSGGYNMEYNPEEQIDVASIDGEGVIPSEGDDLQ